MAVAIDHSTSAIVRKGEPTWSEVRDLFLRAVIEEQRSAVVGLLREPRWGGRGLRMWLRTLVTQGRSLPEVLPSELIQVYLDDPEALPLHDCSDCGLAVPIRSGWLGLEGEPERIYFPVCPNCGSRTGLYAFWSNTRGH